MNLLGRIRCICLQPLHMLVMKVMLISMSLYPLARASTVSGSELQLALISARSGSSRFVPLHHIRLRGGANSGGMGWRSPGRWAVVLPGRSFPRSRQGADSRRITCACAVPPLGFPPLGWDVGMGAISAAASVLWVKLWTSLASRDMLKPQMTRWRQTGRWFGISTSGTQVPLPVKQRKVSRKMVHTTAAPLFMLLWPFFSPGRSARFIAAAVPLSQAIRLTLAGLSDDARRGPNESTSELVKGISRSGRASEALEGPLKYSLVLFLLTAVEWRRSIPGVVAILQMAVGDGVADLVGRRFGKHKWRRGGKKSLEGTAAFAVGAFASSMGILGWLKLFGSLDVSPPAVATRVAIVSVACALMELAPPSVVGDDNISVPLTAMVLGRVLFSGVGQ